MTHKPETRDHNGRTETQRKMLMKHATETRKLREEIQALPITTLACVDIDASLAKLAKRQWEEYKATMDSVQLAERELADHRHQAKREYQQAKADMETLASKHRQKFCELTDKVKQARLDRMTPAERLAIKQHEQPLERLDQ